MTKVEAALLTTLHRRWIETRDGNDQDRFAAFLAGLVRRDAKERFPAFPCGDQNTP